VAYTNHMVMLLDRIPHGVLVLGKVSLGLVVLYFAILIAARQWKKWIPSLSAWIKPASILLSVGLVAALGWKIALGLPDSNLHVTAFDLPDGPAILVQSPGGENVLINGSSSASQLGSVLGQRLPLLQHHLDGVLLSTRSDAVLYGMPPVLERFPVKQMLWNSTAALSASSENLKAELQRQGKQAVVLASGQVLDFGNGIQLEVLLEASSGTSLLLEWNNFQVLIPGGIPLKALQRSVEQILASIDVIVLTPEDLQEHGLEEWEALRPVVVLWTGNSVGIDPASGLSGWINLEDYTWVSLETDGVRLWASSQQ
jgi:hypothetical protein